MANYDDRPARRSLPVGRPRTLPAPLARLYEVWLAPNGIDEPLPLHPTFTVSDGWIAYDGYVWMDGRRGWDGATRLQLGGNPMLPMTPVSAIEQRRVPLQAPVTGEVRLLFAQLTAALVET